MSIIDILPYQLVLDGNVRFKCSPKNRFFGQKIDFLGHFGVFCEFGPIEVALPVKNVSDELEG